jgi:hypothetical protein
MKESSFIKDVHWFEGLLYVTFKNGKIYEFSDVQESVYNDFIAADSLGKFFAANIKDKYETKGFDAPAVQKSDIHGSDVPQAWPFPTGSKPKEGPPVEDIEGLEEFLEWTEQEEEEFLRILDDPENDGMDGATT